MNTGTRPEPDTGGRLAAYAGNAACYDRDTAAFQGFRRVVVDALPVRPGETVLVVVRGRHVGDEDRRGVIIEVHGEDGTPPYVVRWDNGHESVFVPSSDTVVEHHPRRQAAS